MTWTAPRWWLTLLPLAGCVCVGPQEVQFLRGGPAAVEHRLETVVTLGRPVTGPSGRCLDLTDCSNHTTFTPGEVSQVRARFDSPDFEVLSTQLLPKRAEVRWVAHALGTGNLEVTLTDASGVEVTGLLPLDAVVPEPLLTSTDCRSSAEGAPLVLQTGATRVVHFIVRQSPSVLVRVEPDAGFDAGEPVEILVGDSSWVQLRARSAGHGTLTLRNVPGGLPLVVFDEATPGRVSLVVTPTASGASRIDVVGEFEGARTCTGLSARHQVTTTSDPPGRCVADVPDGGPFEAFEVTGSGCTVTVASPWGTGTTPL